MESPHPEDPLLEDITKKTLELQKAKADMMARLERARKEHETLRKQREDLMKNKSEALKRKEEGLKKRGELLHRRDELTKQKAEVLKSKELMVKDILEDEGHGHHQTQEIPTHCSSKKNLEESYPIVRLAGT
eukprot:TRINITY_DN4096_c0_g1_i1.p1 TRINITY_DN4096_c0_g1~~TRINITY_DN4096_c0_g1_i1.p1  ORF type:complete len:132 (-),score=32.15 TRINITY_DN4096_c0_g1_i1:175-570(-)